MVRLHELWQQAKAELHEKTQRLERLERQLGPVHTQRQQEAEGAVTQLNALALELRDKLRFTELQLAASREEGGQLSGTLNELRRMVSEAQAQLTEEQQHRYRQEQLVRELQTSVQRSAADKQEALEEAYEGQRRLEATMQVKEQAVLLHEQKLHAAYSDLRETRELYASSVRAMEEANSRAAEHERVNGELSKQLLAFKEQLKHEHLSRRSDTQSQHTLLQLQQDNARLVKLLASTSEYRDFAGFGEDSGGLSYMPPRSGQAQVSEPLGLSAFPRADALPLNDRPVKGPSREADFWVPADAYAIANEFRHQHMPSLSSQPIAELLLKLNRVWKVREAKRLERQRDKWMHKVNELRRRLQQSVPYEEVLHSSEVERLRRELRACRGAAGSGRRRLNETEERLLDSSLESVEELSKQLRQKQDENEQLLITLSEQESRNYSAFGQGASVTAHEANGQMDRLFQRVHELMRDFQQKTMALSRQDPDFFMKLLRLQSWFLETLEKRLTTCRDRMAGVYDAALASQRSSQPRHASANSAAPALCGTSATRPGDDSDDVGSGF